MVKVSRARRIVSSTIGVAVRIPAQMKRAVKLQFSRIVNESLNVNLPAIGVGSVRVAVRIRALLLSGHWRDAVRQLLEMVGLLGRPNGPCRPPSHAVTTALRRRRRRRGSSSGHRPLDSHGMMCVCFWRKPAQNSWFEPVLNAINIYIYIRDIGM